MTETTTTQATEEKVPAHDERLISPLVPAIHACMVGIMSDVEPIAKDRQGHGYKFRGIDDVYIALQAVMARHGVYNTSEIVSERTEEKTSNKGGQLIYRILRIRWTFWCADDASSVTTETVGEAMDSSDKASNKAMSAAHKYALMQAFCIPTDEPKDSENDNHKLKGHPDEHGQTSRQSGGGRGNTRPDKTRQAGPEDYQDSQDDGDAGQDDSPPPGPKIFSSVEPEDLMQLKKYLEKHGKSHLMREVAGALNGLTITRENLEAAVAFFDTPPQGAQS